MSFDYGCDPEDLKGTPGNNFKVWPTTGERTGLVDADAIPYIVGYTSTEQEYLEFKRSTEPFLSKVWLRKKDHANFLLNSWLDSAACDSALLYLTDGLNNFRLKIGTVKIYKAQRSTEKPPFFNEIKRFLVSEHGAHMSEGCEADDDISIEAWRRHEQFATANGKEILFTKMHERFSDFVIISKDKDLRIIPGMHLPPDIKPADKIWITPLGWLEPKYKETEVIAYECWPTFNGVKEDPKKLVALINYKGNIAVRGYHQLKCPMKKWEQDHVWHKLGGTSLVKQDCYTRGVKKGLGKYKRVAVGKEKSNVLDKLGGTGLTFFYTQLVTGDNVDNYPGIPGVGPKRAYEILNGAVDEADLCNRVACAYLEHYIDPDVAHERMIEQGRLAWMQTKRNELWELPMKGGSSFPL